MVRASGNVKAVRDEQPKRASDGNSVTGLFLKFISLMEEQPLNAREPNDVTFCKLHAPLKEASPEKASSPISAMLEKVRNTSFPQSAKANFPILDGLLSVERRRRRFAP